MLKIRKLGVLKMASFLGLFSFFVGLISAFLIWVIMDLFFIHFIGGTQVGGIGDFINIGFSLTNLILFPIIYGVAGFIIGLIFTPVMNLIFKIIGGLDIIIEEPGE